MSESTESHRRAAAGSVARCAILTVSDSRSADNDGGGDLIQSFLLAAGHEVADRRWVHDDAHEIARPLTEWLASDDVHVVVTTGGTGISRRDTTVEVVERFLDKRLDGFGELFRALSFQEIGSAAILSRAVGGMARGTFIFALPGSVAAVELALDRLIVPELEHLVWERGR